MTSLKTYETQNRVNGKFARGRRLPKADLPEGWDSLHPNAVETDREFCRSLSVGILRDHQIFIADLNKANAEFIAGIRGVVRRSAFLWGVSIAAVALATADLSFNVYRNWPQLVRAFGSF